MNWLDLAILIVIGLITFLGFKRGLIQSLVPFVGIALGIIIAGNFYSALADKIPIVDSENQAKIIAFIILLIISYIGVQILGSILHKMVRLVLLGWADRLGGLFLGFATSWLATSMIVVLLARFVALPANLPEIPVASLNDWVKDWRGIENIRDSVNNTLDGSAMATTQIKNFPAVLNLLPSEFDAVKDFLGQ